MKEMEVKKRVLEEAVDSLNEEMSKITAEGKALHQLWLKVAPNSFMLDLRPITCVTRNTSDW